jgi:hypothetical protein
MKHKPLATAELNRIIARFDTGQGVTAAVQAFADAVPVAERTVWYWLGGRKVHRAMAARIRQIGVEKETKSAEPFLALRLCQRCSRGRNSRYHLRECGRP